MDAGMWLSPGGWGSPVGLAIFMAGLGFFFAGFGLFFACIGRLNQSNSAKAEYELEESQRHERAAAREGGSG
jgi:hypothetical protein